MTENQIKETIKVVIGTNLKSCDMKVIKRDFQSDFYYVATIAVLAKEITPETIKALSDYIKDGNDDFSLSSSEIDISTFDKEVLLLTAEIQI